MSSCVHRVGSKCTMNIASCPQLIKAEARVSGLLGTDLLPSHYNHEPLISGQKDEKDGDSVTEELEMPFCFHTTNFADDN